MKYHQKLPNWVSQHPRTGQWQVHLSCLVLDPPETKISVEKPACCRSFCTKPWVCHLRGKSQFSVGKSNTNGSFSIAMLVYQRGVICNFPVTWRRNVWFNAVLWACSMNTFQIRDEKNCNVRWRRRGAMYRIRFWVNCYDLNQRPKPTDEGLF